MDIPFSKYNGCGNDFIIIDNRTMFFPSQDVAFIHHLCQRQQGIGADGLILLEASREASFKMRIFNSDGRETEMCGNGARCIVKFAQEIGLQNPPYTIQTMHSILLARYEGDDISIDMGIPHEIEWSKTLTIDGQNLTVHWLDTGVPHAVLFVDQLQEDKWMTIAPQIRSHTDFHPKGVNVNFATLSNDLIEVRTYERGVEGETLACGTGATAVALAAAKLNGRPSPIRLKTRSGDLLKVHYTCGLKFENVRLAGPALRTFNGTI